MMSAILGLSGLYGGKAVTSLFEIIDNTYYFQDVLEVVVDTMIMEKLALVHKNRFLNKFQGHDIFSGKVPLGQQFMCQNMF